MPKKKAEEIIKSEEVKKEVKPSKSSNTFVGLMIGALTIIKEEDTEINGKPVKLFSFNDGTTTTMSIEVFKELTS